MDGAPDRLWLVVRGQLQRLWLVVRGQLQRLWLVVREQLQRLWLVERGGLVLEHEAGEVAEGEAGVEDVFDDDDVLALDGVVDVLDELDGSGGDAGAAVAGDGDEVEGVVDTDGAGEVGEEDGCAFE